MTTQEQVNLLYAIRAGLEEIKETRSRDRHTGIRGFHSSKIRRRKNSTETPYSRFRSTSHEKDKR